MQILIGPVAYNVLFIPEFSESGRCGDIDVMKARIRINADMAQTVQTVTLWHEVLHGILANAGYKDHNEEQIDALAYGILQVLRDNPDLIPQCDTGVPEA